MSDQSITEEPAGDDVVAEEAPVAAATPATEQPASQQPADDAPEARKNARKVREGVVVSITMEKTAVVATIDRVRHRRYVKTVQRTKRLYAHDENNETRLGDRVRIIETRSLSKLKRWRVVEILERAK